MSGIHRDYEDTHGLAGTASSRVGPTYQGAGSRTVFGSHCNCGWGSSNSASRESAIAKHREHAEAENAAAEAGR